MQRLKQVEDENRRPKQIVAEQTAMTVEVAALLQGSFVKHYRSLLDGTRNSKRRISSQPLE